MSKSARLADLNMERQRTTVGYLRRHEVDGRFHESLVDLFAREGGRRVAGRITIESSPRIASSRNMLVRQFLKSEVPWLLMLDDDIVFTPDILERLHRTADATECPVVSGLYFLGGQENELRPAMQRFAKSMEHEMLASSPVHDYPENEVIDVDAVGAGCMLIHRSVLEQLAEKWEGRSAFPFFAETEMSLQEFGEDFTFCLRLRAIGVPVRVDTGLVVGHSKGWVFTDVEYRQSRVAQKLEATR